LLSQIKNDVTEKEIVAAFPEILFGTPVAIGTGEAAVGWGWQRWSAGRSDAIGMRRLSSEETGPEAGQYFHVRPPIGFI